MTNPLSKVKLPSNPYKRSPIRKKEDLAGRSTEQKRIKYYFGLTVSGESPHLALIGQRGIGKTSLLNWSEITAKELKLLSVRLDMNEMKANSPGRFWYDFYQSLALAMVKEGCWGGERGVIYQELLRMIHSREPGNLDKAVMQIPYIFSCHQGNIESLECPDALIINDLKVCLKELRERELAGIVIFIDEADCLGKNVPLLQMFRNIFQVVENCSIVLAGTDAVFPVLSEVFSPIPRQFHRINVEPFSHSTDTMHLIMQLIPKEFRNKITPKYQVMLELHRLCGGAPDEIQLYCHHMYRLVEEGSAERMILSPQVFREVIREYRVNTPNNVEEVLSAIQRLPDKMLYNSKWLSRTQISISENIRITQLKEAFKLNRVLLDNEKSAIDSELTEGYSRLFDAGITSSKDYIRLSGAPLTSGFWKSYVNLEREKGWSWEENSFTNLLNKFVVSDLVKDIDADGFIPINFENKDLKVLESVRKELIPLSSKEDISDMIFSAVVAKEKKLKYAIDIAFEIKSISGKFKVKSRIFEKKDIIINQDKVQEWIQTHQRLLADNEIVVTLLKATRWELPNKREIHRLCRIFEYPIPSNFYPTPQEEAINKFNNGDIAGAMNEFSQMLKDRDDPNIRNNLAFCQLLLGQFSEAVKNLTDALTKDYCPLTELNKGVGLFLLGNVDEAKKLLINALSQLQTHSDKYDLKNVYVLVVDASGLKVEFHSDLPTDVAIIINLWRIGDFDSVALKEKLSSRYPEKTHNWLEKFGV